MSHDAVASMSPAENAVGSVRQCAITYNFPEIETGTYGIVGTDGGILFGSSRFLDNGLHYTVSWWIRKLSCIAEVPRFFFFKQFKIKFKNLNWLQLNLN